ncbi:MAG: hypothetical protein ACPG4U_06120 [Pseudomonadales bacterium]
MSAKKKPLVIVIAVVVLAALGGGGYFAYMKLQQKTEENIEQLEDVGEALVGEAYKDKANADAAAPSLTEKLEPSEKVVRSLQRENIKLTTEIKILEEKLEELKGQIVELEDYKQTNERFAPARMKDEKADVESQVKNFLLDSEDAERFSVVQIEIMSAASAMEYEAYVTRNRLMVSRAQREKLAIEYLPGFAFCVGDGVELAANNGREFELVASKFRGQIGLPLPKRLQEDLDAVMTPCQNTLRATLDASLEEK